MNRVIHIEEPLRRPQSAPPPGFALWQLGFRPFYLLASSFAALSIALWALQYAGVLGMPYLFEQPNLGKPSENHLYFDPGDGRLLTGPTARTAAPEPTRRPT